MSSEYRCRYTVSHNCCNSESPYFPGNRACQPPKLDTARKVYGGLDTYSKLIKIRPKLRLWRPLKVRPTFRPFFSNLLIKHKVSCRDRLPRYCRFFWQQKFVTSDHWIFMKFTPTLVHIWLKKVAKWKAPKVCIFPHFSTNKNDHGIRNIMWKMEVAHFKIHHKILMKWKRNLLWGI